jgi:hypothetical protein
VRERREDEEMKAYLRNNIDAYIDTHTHVYLSDIHVLFSRILENPSGSRSRGKRRQSL